MKQIVFDIEANGLKPTKVWVIVAKELDTSETHTFSGDTLLSFNDYIVGLGECETHWSCRDWLTLHGKAVTRYVTGARST